MTSNSLMALRIGKQDDQHGCNVLGWQAPRSQRETSRHRSPREADLGFGNVRPLATSCRSADQARWASPRRNSAWRVGERQPRAGRKGDRQVLISLYHLVGAREQRWRNFDTQSTRGLDVDHQLEFCRLLDRKLGRIGAL